VRAPPHEHAPLRPDASGERETGRETLAERDVSAPQANTYRLLGVKRGWSVAAALCLVVACALGWRGHYDGTFVVATLGLVAWFLDQRNLLRARSIENDLDEEDVAESQEQDEE
jgi:hypothetical protein